MEELNHVTPSTTTPRKHRPREAANDPDFDRGPEASSAPGELFNARSLEREERRKRPHPAGQSPRSGGLIQRRAGGEETTPPYVAGGGFAAIQDIEGLVAEIQGVYYDITRLEALCMKGHNELASQSTFDEDQWTALYRSHAMLMERYYDFMVLAHHPLGNSVVRALVKKYRIVLRIWNKGVFKLFELLRGFLPHSKPLIKRFALCCFPLLTMLTEQPYESRFTWLEALGDISRFAMILDPDDTVDWRRNAQDWYSRAISATPGTGRLYHHCAVVCVHKIDSLFYFCKSMSAYMPFAPSRETILALFRSNENSAMQYMKLYDESLYTFVKVHSSIFEDEGGKNAQFERRYTGLDATAIKIINLGIQSFPDIATKSAMYAGINITALLGFANVDQWGPRNVLAQPFYKPVKKPADAGAESAETMELEADEGEEAPEVLTRPSLPARQISFTVLESFCKNLGTAHGYAHLLVWTHFLFALDDAGIVGEVVYDELFPAALYAEALTQCARDALTTISREVPRCTPQALPEMIDRWKKQYFRKQIVPGQRQANMENDFKYRSDSVQYDLLGEVVSQQLAATDETVMRTQVHVPSVKERPLPEEVAIIGFSWLRHKLFRKSMLSELELMFNDNPYPGYSYDEGYNKIIRPVRIAELALMLAKESSSWLGYSAQGQFFIKPQNI
ncbi:hypothetical protein TRVA0_012S00782 [Trichomonascus vanleenenianus]|uniref:uncharacterized protein n=1 Tax=Trichomonascus vanleenenianus TaxID=2268995 RepID=UPI003ECB2335